MEKIFIYLTELSSGAAYFIVFGILIACGLGFPLPEDIPLIAAGYLVSDGTMRWVPAILITMAGVLIGDSILFFLGKKMGMKILENTRVQSIFKPEKIRRTKAYFRKYGDKIVFFARFVAGFRAPAFFMAGALKMNYRRFLLLDGLAALISVPLWIILGYAMGYYLGDEIASILKGMKEIKLAVTILIVTVITIFTIRGWLKYQKARKLGMQRRRKAS